MIARFENNGAPACMGRMDYLRVSIRKEKNGLWKWSIQATGDKPAQGFAESESEAKASVMEAIAFRIF